MFYNKICYYLTYLFKLENLIFYVRAYILFQRVDEILTVLYFFFCFSKTYCYDYNCHHLCHHHYRSNNNNHHHHYRHHHINITQKTCYVFLLTTPLDPAHTQRRLLQLYNSLFYMLTITGCNYYYNRNVLSLRLFLLKVSFSYSTHHQA